MRENFRSPPTT